MLVRRRDVAHEDWRDWLGASTRRRNFGRLLLEAAHEDWRVIYRCDSVTDDQVQAFANVWKKTADSMTTRRYYLFSYDVADDKRRNKVFEALLARGDHLQFSVFVCELNPREMAELQAILIGILDHRKDQVLYIDLGPANNPLDTGIETIGAPLQFSTRVLVV